MDSLTLEKVSTLTVKGLKDILRENGLSLKGNKGELLERVNNFIKKKSNKSVETKSNNVTKKTSISSKTKQNVTSKNKSKTKTLSQTLKSLEKSNTTLRPKTKLKDIKLVLKDLNSKEYFGSKSIIKEIKDNNYILIFEKNHLHIYKSEENKINIGVRIKIEGFPETLPFEIRYDYNVQHKCKKMMTTSRPPYLHLFRPSPETKRGSVLCFNKTDLDKSLPQLRSKLLNYFKQTFALKKTDEKNLEIYISNALQKLQDTLTLLYEYASKRDTPVTNHFGGNKIIK